MEKTFTILLKVILNIKQQVSTVTTGIKISSNMKIWRITHVKTDHNTLIVIMDKTIVTIIIEVVILRLIDNFTVILKKRITQIIKPTKPMSLKVTLNLFGKNGSYIGWLL